MKTPDRKSSQLCHVNMLKVYVEREESGVAVCCSVPSDEVGKESGNGTVSWTCKLTNSEVLSNLDEKLAHLSKEQCEAMKALLLR